MGATVGKVAPWAMINDADKSEVIRQLARGYSINEAAKRAGRTRIMVETWMQTDRAFQAALTALNSSKDDEVMEFRERVRRAAGEMLDNLTNLAESSKAEQTRLGATKAFFEVVHNPIFAPRSAAASAMPAVFVNAAQAQILLAPPTNGATNGDGSPAGDARGLPDVQERHGSAEDAGPAGA